MLHAVEHWRTDVRTADLKEPGGQSSRAAADDREWLMRMIMPRSSHQ